MGQGADAFDRPDGRAMLRVLYNFLPRHPAIFGCRFIPLIEERLELEEGAFVQAKRELSVMEADRAKLVTNSEADDQ
jgi:hypothetical protein